MCYFLIYIIINIIVHTNNNIGIVYINVSLTFVVIF